MPVYNKLKITILAIISSQNIYALSLDPIQVQSGAGNLLYAEMKFRNADPNLKIEAGLAETQDLIDLGLAHQAPGHLNFFTRRSSDGTGVIVITSTRPMVETELNILLKIKEGNATHIQQVKTRLNRISAPTQVATSIHEKSLQPHIIVSEKDIALNLPSSTQFKANSTPPSNVSTSSLKPNLSATTASNHSSATALVITTGPIPSLNPAITTQNSVLQNTQSSYTVASSNSSINASVKVAEASANVATMSQVLPIQTTLQPDVVAQTQAKPIVQEKSPERSLKTESQSTAEKPVKKLDRVQADSKQNSSVAPDFKQPYVVQLNESLWKIAAKVAAQNNQSIPEVMKQIKADNQHAFIGGNINRIRRGVALNLAAGSPVKPKAKPLIQSANTYSKQSGKAKYKINQAEMSLVTDSVQDSAQGTSKEKVLRNQTNPELSTKVMTARQKTVKLQKNVSKLTLTLQQKDRRIQLLNARLAQLQQQLQQQDQAKKSAH